VIGLFRRIEFGEEKNAIAFYLKKKQLKKRQTTKKANKVSIHLQDFDD